MDYVCYSLPCSTCLVYQLENMKTNSPEKNERKISVYSNLSPVLILDQLP